MQVCVWKSMYMQMGNVWKCVHAGVCGGVGVSACKCVGVGVWECVHADGGVQECAGVCACRCVGSVCVQAWGCECVCMQLWGVQECAHAEARGGPRVVSSTTLELIPLRQSPLWDLKTTLWIGWLVDSQEST